MGNLGDSMKNMWICLLILAGCPGPTVPVVEAGCANACANAETLKCIAVDAGCEVTCQKTVNFKLTDLKLGCLTAATNKTDFIACGTMSCP